MLMNNIQRFCATLIYINVNCHEQIKPLCYNMKSNVTSIMLQPPRTIVTSLDVVIVFFKARIAIEFYPTAILWKIRFKFLFLDASNDAAANEQFRDKNMTGHAFIEKIITKEPVYFILLINTITISK